MNTVIILGNGFDLDLGLPTHFRQFLISHRHLPIKTPILNRKIYGDSKWCDIEGLLRELSISYCLNPSVKLLEEIRDTKMLISKGWAQYLLEEIQLEKIHIDKKSYAYTFIKEVQNKHIWYSFNYTDPFYLSGERNAPIINHVHGALIPYELSPFEMYKLPVQELIIGIDYKKMKSTLRKELEFLVKQKQREYHESKLTEALYEADIVIFAVGKAKMFDRYNVMPNTTVIDVGINVDENGKLCGDFDPEGIEDWFNIDYTPVPGGVGPMTIAMLLENTLQAYHQREV